MRIKTLEVTNYRALRNAEIQLSPATVLIGENNCGKSAFLRALDLFFSGSPRIKPKDFTDDNVGEPIDITAHFSQLTPHESVEFSSNLIDGELIVTRRLTDRYAAWDYTLEKFVEGKDAAKFAAVRTAVAAEFHIDPSSCLKFPATAFEILKQLEEDGVHFAELDEVIAKVDKLID